MTSPFTRVISQHYHLSFKSLELFLGRQTLKKLLFLYRTAQHRYHNGRWK